MLCYPVVFCCYTTGMTRNPRLPSTAHTTPLTSHSPLTLRITISIIPILQGRHVGLRVPGWEDLESVPRHGSRSSALSTSLGWAAKSPWAFSSKTFILQGKNLTPESLHRLEVMCYTHTYKTRSEVCLSSRGERDSPRVKVQPRPSRCKTTGWGRRACRFVTLLLSLCCVEFKCLTLTTNPETCSLTSLDSY